jgi:hypothetical protein
MKALRYSLAVLAFAAVGACMIVLRLPARQVEASSPHMSPSGFIIGEPIRKPMPFPRLTRDQLVTRGHADDKAEIDALLQTYMFYHDTHDGEGVASLFTKDGALEHLWNNGGKTVEPNAGPNGLGCYVATHEEIAGMYKARVGPGGGNTLGFPGHSHNLVTNNFVQVRGDTATIYADFTSIRSNDVPAGKIVGTPPNTASLSHDGEDIGDLVRTPEGWRFVHLRVLEDEQMKFGTPTCEANVVGH